ncbi:MAG: beta-galactosidase, partial [Solirubrobacteraceae bacterium]|nr:beta-galactosidase [Solirubrobacteraceae bacterium]
MSLGRTAAALCALAAATAAALAPSAGSAADPPPSPPASEPRQALLGQWTYRADPHDVGEHRGWARTPPAMAPVEVPGVANASPLAGPRARRAHDGTVGWWRTTLAVNPAGRYEVRFGSVHHRATVWIDGRRVARHTGTYLPFEARARLSAGAHRLVVRADWRDPAAMKADAWHRTWFNFGGINGPVHLRPIGASELDSPSVVTRLRRDGAAQVDVTVRVTNHRAARALFVRGTLGAERLRFAPVALGRGAHGTVRARAVVRRPDLWAPGHPALTALRLAVGRESAYT